MNYCLCNNQWRSFHGDWIAISKEFAYNEEELRFDLSVAVNAAHLCILMSTKVIEQLPSISEEEIKDKSNEDVVVKALALGQVLWFFVELIERKVSGLPSTQLEISVLSFAVCTCITYLLWFKKPKDTEVSTDVFTTRSLDNEDRKLFVSLNYVGFFEGALLYRDLHKPGPTIPNDSQSIEAFLSVISSKYGFSSEDVGFIFGAVIFGACHCIAWNFEFPTPIEQTLWRAASAFTAAVMPVYYLALFLVQYKTLAWTFYEPRGRVVTATQILGFTAFPLYVVCRLYIVVKVFRSLFYLPPNAFVATWSASVPYID